LDAQEWTEALPLLRELWASEDRLVEDAVGLVKCLRKTDGSQEGIRVARDAARLLRDGNGLGSWSAESAKRVLYGLAAWCVWDLDVKGVEDPTTLEQGVRRIRGTLEEIGTDLHEPRAPYVRSVLQYAKAALARGRAEPVLEFLSLLEPTSLSDERYTPPDGRPMPSDRERWYLHRAKALAGVSQWEALLEHTESGARDTSLDERTRYFLGYRGGMSLRQLGRLDDAIAGLKELAARRREWYVLHELARARWASGDRGGAQRDALIGLLDIGLDEITSGLVLHIGEWRHEEGDNEVAALCRRFVEEAREAKGWPIKGELAERLHHLPEGPQDDQMTGRRLESSLRRSCFRVLDDVDPPSRGTVKSVIGNGKAAFIRSSIGSDVYARVRRGMELHEGLDVEFRTVPSFDRKKRQISCEAIHVRAVSS
jgi:hypothetical protein